MKKTLIVVIGLIGILLSGCITIDPPLEPCWVYQVRNTTADTLEVKVSFVNETQVDTTISIKPNYTSGLLRVVYLLDLDSIEPGASLPSKQFTALYICSTAGDTLYRQQPINDSLWTVNREGELETPDKSFLYTLTYPLPE